MSQDVFSLEELTVIRDALDLQEVSIRTAGRTTAGDLVSLDGFCALMILGNKIRKMMLTAPSLRQLPSNDDN